MAQAPALPRGFELPLKQRLPRIGSIDQVAVEARAGELAKRSIKKDAKVWALELAIRCCDLTTLEGQDTPGKVAALCSKAVRPDPSDANVPSVAAVCVYPNLVPTAKEKLRGSGVKVASVATAFPSGQSPIDVKLRDVQDAVAFGADGEAAAHLARVRIALVDVGAVRQLQRHGCVADELHGRDDVVDARAEDVEVVPRALVVHEQRVRAGVEMADLGA